MRSRVLSSKRVAWPRADRHPARALSRRQKHTAAVPAARFDCARALSNSTRSPPEQIKGEAERRTAHPTMSASAQPSVAACLRGRGARALSGDALAFRRSTAALAKALRPWLSPVPRFMVADNRSAPRAASSWQTGDVAGRASFRTARTRSAKPRAGTALTPPSGSHPESALRRASRDLLVRGARRIQEIPERPASL
jgi:hypothetical protein